jgi:hypothetical protein
MKFPPYYTAAAHHDAHAARPLLTRHAFRGAHLATRFGNRPPAPNPQPPVDEPAKNALTCADVTSGENLAL